MLKIVFVLLFLLTATTLPASAEESSPPVPEASQTSLGAIIRFDDAVLPLLKDRCVHCHGPAVRKSSLDLSRWDHLEQGGENGVVINREDPEASLIWQKVVSDEMPPDRPLRPEEKQLLRDWLLRGASGPDVPQAESGEHWTFRPLQPRTLPEVRSADRVRTPVDRWIQFRLEQMGLSLHQDASPETQIRRVAFDLTGLPPTPEELRRFLDDRSEQAYEQMVDHYLESPHYGERWGKHWLEAAGYADSNGYFSADTDRPFAWRYRDYVIRSVNADKPFDQFVREQLAGDELASFTPDVATTADTIELLEATHFLRNGQDGTDIGVQEPEAFEIDRRAALEATVQVTASSLLGLTIHCARCHDHKFEPLSQREYYQFQAVFFPAFNPQNWINPKDRVVYAWLPGEKEEWQKREAEITANLEGLRREYQNWTKEHREPSDLLLSESFVDGTWKQRWDAAAPGDDAPSGNVQIGAADGQTGAIGTARLRPSSRQASTSSSPNDNPVSAPTDTAAAPAENSGDGVLQIIAGAGEAWLSTKQSFDWTPDVQDGWIQATFDLVDNKVALNDQTPGTPAERIGYAIATHDFNDSGAVAGGNLLIDGNPMTSTTVYKDYPGGDSAPIGSIGEQGYVAGRNYGVRITRIGDNMFRLEHRVDGLPEGKSIELTAADLPDGGFAFFFCSGRSYEVDDVRIERSSASATPTPELTALREKIQARYHDYEAARKELLARRSSGPGRAIAWVSDASADLPQVPFLTRGQYHLRDGAVDAQPMKMLSGEGDSWQPTSESATSSTTKKSTGRRSAFAAWLTQKDSRPEALLARVHVNRIWARYFGRGIVPTTDNLGQSGSSASHPELLDWLALTFRDSGWSQKAIHRLIVTSSVYRQSSTAHPEGLAADSANRFLWRFPVRRLDAECIRDGMLQTAGLLDRTFFGPYVPTQQSATGEVLVSSSTPGAYRRSVYLQQRRSQTLSLLKVFDAPAIATVCSSRPSSTVPLQSLALLNSEFAVECAERFAKQLLQDFSVTHPDNARDLVQSAWLRTAGRKPEASELLLMTEFLKGQVDIYPESDANRMTYAVADLCQMLLASNPFLYLE